MDGGTEGGKENARGGGGGEKKSNIVDAEREGKRGQVNTKITTSVRNTIYA